MIRTAIVTVALAMALAGPALANPVSTDPTTAPKGDYILDKRHASLLVKIAHMGGFSKFTMRSDFAVTPASPFAGDDLDLIFEVEFVKT